MSRESISYPKVSIVIPVYNGANYLSEAIESALNQDYPNIEVIVINDGSTDAGKTENIATSYGNKICYFHKENGGVASALNFGISKMQGEYFSWLSHDDIYKSNKVSQEIQALNQCGDMMRIVCCGYDVIDEQHNFLYTINPVNEYGKDVLEIPLFPVFHCCINGCGMLIHKNHFKRVGMFREDLPTTQDYDFWFRVLRGQQMLFIDSICFYSRSHDEQGSRKAHDKHVDECNELWIRLFEALTVKEKIQMAGTELNFYKQELKRFKQTDYDKTITYLKYKFIKKKILDSPLRMIIDAFKK